MVKLDIVREVDVKVKRLTKIFKKNKFLDDKAIDLINLMLSENIELRPNISEILHHDYFKS